MATLAEMMFQSASQSAQKEPGIADAYVKGTELAQKAEQLQQSRAQIDAVKEANQNEKLKMFSDDIQKAKGLTGRAAQGYGKFLKAKRANLGLNDIFDDQTLDFITATPENLDRFIALKNNVRAGKMTLDEAIVKSKDPSQFLEIAPEMYDELYKASEGKIAATEAQRRAEAEARASLGKQMQAQEAAPDVALKTTLAKEAATYDPAIVDANEKALVEVINDLEKKNITTGSYGSLIPTEKGRKLVIGDVIAAENKAKKAIQASLRQTLGGNFTENEGTRIENRTFDKDMDNNANIAALKDELAKIRQTRKAKEEGFKRFGIPFSTGRSAESEEPIPASVPEGKREAYKKLSPEAKQLYLKNHGGK